jgi:nicotinate-nucleotide pyrophosphorylase (carboxylating)
MVASLPDIIIEPVVRAALAEDLGRAGDVTAMACIPAAARMSATFGARKSGVISGLCSARLAITALDPEARFETNVADGAHVDAGTLLARVSGNARAILSAERTGLNLLGRMSGIATLTAAYVAAVAGTGARIADTRKTTPGLRALEKYAVRCGGGVNHRFGLDDAILIKDNHIAAAGSVACAIDRARAFAGHLMKVEVEVDSLDQFDEALKHGPDVIMLDNFGLAELSEAVRRAAGRVTLEASGGVSLSTVGAIAATGVDVISVGALTHSAPVLDIGLDAA